MASEEDAGRLAAVLGRIREADDPDVTDDAVGRAALAMLGDPDWGEDLSVQAVAAPRARIWQLPGEGTDVGWIVKLDRARGGYVSAPLLEDPDARGIAWRPLDDPGQSPP